MPSATTHPGSVVTRGMGSPRVVTAGLAPGAPPRGSLVTRGLGTRRLVAAGMAPLAVAPTLRRALKAALEGCPALSAVVGTNVFPLHVPEAALLPAVVYQVTSVERTHDLSGAPGVARASARVGVASRDFADCEAGAEAVRNLLDGFRGYLGGLLPVRECVNRGEEDSYADPANATDRGVYWVVIDYDLTYAETRHTD